MTTFSLKLGSQYQGCSFFFGHMVYGETFYGALQRVQYGCPSWRYQWLARVSSGIRPKSHHYYYYKIIRQAWETTTVVQKCFIKCVICQIRSFWLMMPNTKCIIFQLRLSHQHCSVVVIILFIIRFTVWQPLTILLHFLWTCTPPRYFLYNQLLLYTHSIVYLNKLCAWRHNMPPPPASLIIIISCKYDYHWIC